MDLQAKLTSLLKEKEEQEQIEKKARDNIRLLNLMIKPIQRELEKQQEVDPDKVITKDPVYIKENESKPSAKSKSESFLEKANQRVRDKDGSLKKTTFLMKLEQREKKKQEEDLFPGGVWNDVPPPPIK